MTGLHVWRRRDCVGSLQVDRDDRMEFCYDARWLASSDAFSISLSLPLRGEPYREAAHHFFANMLPEADVRARLCQRLKVTPGNDFELLRLIGGECAGALTISLDPPAEAG